MVFRRREGVSAAVVGYVLMGGNDLYLSEIMAAVVLLRRETPLTISKGAAGHYWVTGLVNGYSVPFMVDTGASKIAMNAQQARRLGIDFKTKGSPVMVSTASGTEKAWRVYLNSVKLGAIEVLGVDAMVLDGEFPRDVLLGMSFLSRVSWREDQGALIVEANMPSVVD